MRINKYFPFAVIYFFLNSLGLPFGLTYTALLSPFFYWWVLTTRKQEILLPFFIVMLPFVLIQVNIEEVDVKSYFISSLNLTAIYIYCQAFYTFLITCNDPETIFKKLVILNFIFCLIAIPFYFTPYYHIFWIEQFLTAGIDNYRRFKLFTYEASFYATLFVPLFFFYSLQIVLKQNKINAWLLLSMLLLPYILSFSLGVISTIIIAIGVTFLAYFKVFILNSRVQNMLWLAVMTVIAMVVALMIFSPDNTLFSRIENIFSGNDSSGKGRTFDAFIIANKVLAEKSYVWGIGPGQIKILGSEIIRDYYMYPLDFKGFAIPNVTAETLAIFGAVGFVMRIATQIFLFFYTKVWTNYYRLLLFLFIFLYQFTGSFITNNAEYVIWILAFTEVFPQFRVKQPAFAAVITSSKK